MRFQVPMVWGKNEIVSHAQSLDELAKYKKAHPDEVLIKKNMEELAAQLVHISEPMLVDENKNYNRDKAKNYINNLETIGVPITEKDVEVQEGFLKDYSEEIKDEKGRSITVDNDVSRVYDECKQIWKEASLCCNLSTNTPYLIQNVIDSIYVKGMTVDQALDEYEKSIELQKLE